MSGGDGATAELWHQLVALDARGAKARFECMSEAELEAEIDTYKAALRTVMEQLEALGLAFELDESRAEGAPEGQEGVDWRYGSVEDLDPSEWQVPPHCVPIHANVTTYDWEPLVAATQFDVVMMDPPWQLATANPTRGVALGYSQLTDAHIQQLPVPRLQRDGFLFLWVINAKYQFCLDLFDLWGYELVDEVVWVKMTVNRRLAKSHGFYLQHAKEVCLVAKKGRDPPGTRRGVLSDVIFSERRGQSQKPEEIYQMVEALVPNGERRGTGAAGRRYLEIFGRKNNLRDFWVTVGNEVTGQGPPKEDQAAIEAGDRIPNAVYGRAPSRRPLAHLQVRAQQQQQQPAKKSKPRDPLPAYSPPSMEGASLRAEAETPFRSFRLVIFGASAASAALATLFTLPALVGALAGAPGARAATEVLQDLAINLAALLGCGLLVRGDLAAREKQMARLLREDQLGACQLELANGRVLRLAQLRGFARAVVVAGSPAQVAEAVAAAKPYKAALVERGVLLVPLPLGGGDGAAASSAADGSAAAPAAGEPGTSAATQAREDLRWRATPIRADEWRRWFEEQAGLAGKGLERGLYVSLRMDGRVRGSGVGCPPWAAMAAQLPQTEGFFGGLLDGMDGRI
eukprot:scaffold6.g2786.t1